MVEEDEAHAMRAGGRACATAEGHAEGREAAVWRRLLVEDTMSFGRLHVAVQAAMGWENSHLHLFLVEASRSATRGSTTSPKRPG
jgi:hypothetical protein